MKLWGAYACAVLAHCIYTYIRCIQLRQKLFFYISSTSIRAAGKIFTPLSAVLLFYLAKLDYVASSLCSLPPLGIIDVNRSCTELVSLCVCVCVCTYIPANARGAREREREMNSDDAACLWYRVPRQTVGSRDISSSTGLLFGSACLQHLTNYKVQAPLSLVPSPQQQQQQQQRSQRAYSMPDKAPLASILSVPG